jgi:hypothetical protein
MTQAQGIRQEVRQDIHHDIRRRLDGSIDGDFYRARAAALRTQAMQDAFRLIALARFRTPFHRWWTRGRLSRRFLGNPGLCFPGL